MGVKDLLKSETLSLGEYLTIEKGTFYIPFSQRKYEWGKPEVTRLFNDLVGLYNSQNDSHMLNFFTFSNEDGKLKIFDGQQRTVTCLLLISVVAQKLKRYNFDKANKAADQIQETYFVKQDYLDANANNKRKLQFDTSDVNDLFYTITDVDYRYTTKEKEASDSRSYLAAKHYGKNSSNYALVNNYILLNDLLDSYIDDSSKESIFGSDNLVELLKVILNECVLVLFTAATEETATDMFESLNNTGKDLEKYYVLKNNLVKLLGEDKVKKEWQEIDNNILDLSPKNFLAAVATVINGKTQSKEALDKLYIHYDESSVVDMKELLTLLVNASQKYLWISKPNNILSSQYSTTKKEKDEFIMVSEALSIFSIKQYYTIVLAMMLKDIQLLEINRVMRAVLNVGVRNFYFSGDRANTLEGPFASYAKEIFSGSISIDAVVKGIYKSANSDETVKPAILTKVVKSNVPASYLLRLVYNDDLKNDEVEVSRSNVDVEHILPKNPKKNSTWLEWFDDEQERERCTYALGNLTLWIDKNNRGAQNAEFEKKRESYLQSSLKANQEIAQNDEWTSKQIDERTDQLAELILRSLRLPRF